MTINDETKILDNKTEAIKVNTIYTVKQLKFLHYHRGH